MTEIQATVLPFDPPAARAVAALTDYFQRLGESGLVRNRQAPPHIVARSRSFTAASASIAWTLGAMVLARAAGDAEAPAEDALSRESRALHERFDRELREVPKLRKDARCDATESVQLLLSEIAMEERGLELVFERSAAGPPLALSRPLDPVLGAALSFLQLLMILTVQSESDPLVSTERAASQWWFETWSAPPRGELNEITHVIREMEFSFFDREMVSLNDTLASAGARAMPRNAFTVRQRALLDGVRRGVCGIFAVRQRRGSVTVLDDLSSGAT